MRSGYIAISMLIAVQGVVLSAQTGADEKLIRDARARSNAAIAAHDPPAIAQAWMDDVYVPTRCKGSNYCKQRP